MGLVQALCRSPAHVLLASRKTRSPSLSLKAADTIILRTNVRTKHSCYYHETNAQLFNWKHPLSVMNKMRQFFFLIMSVLDRGEQPQHMSKGSNYIKTKGERVVSLEPFAHLHWAGTKTHAVGLPRSKVVLKFTIKSGRGYLLNRPSCCPRRTSQSKDWCEPNTGHKHV